MGPGDLFLGRDVIAAAHGRPPDAPYGPYALPPPSPRGGGENRRPGRPDFRFPYPRLAPLCAGPLPIS
jgi:hypothetical protein